MKDNRPETDQYSLRDRGNNCSQDSIAGQISMSATLFSDPTVNIRLNCVVLFVLSVNIFLNGFGMT